MVVVVIHFSLFSPYELYMRMYLARWSRISSFYSKNSVVVVKAGDINRLLVTPKHMIVLSAFFFRCLNTGLAQGKYQQEPNSMGCGAALFIAKEKTELFGA
jgi:hypothetical protein